MPIFEYRCMDCSKKFSKLVGMTADSRDILCSGCGGKNLLKLVSRFSRARSEVEKLDALEDAAFSGDMDDPKGMARLIKEMGKEIGDDAGDEFDEYLDEAEKELYDSETGVV